MKKTLITLTLAILGGQAWALPAPPALSADPVPTVVELQLEATPQPFPAPRVRCVACR